MSNFKSDSELLSYLAGIVDGEGCIGAYTSSKRPGNYRVLLAVAMTTRIIPQMFVDRFGGKITITFRNLKNPRWKDVYRWNVQCNKAADILQILEPFLVLKKNQAIDAISIARLHSRSLVPKMVPNGTGRRGLISLPLREEQINERKIIAARMVERNS